MKDQDKTKAQLLREIRELRRHLKELEGARQQTDARGEDCKAFAEATQAIFDALPAMIFQKDRANRVVRFNKAMVELTGIPAEDWQTKSCFEIFPEDLAQAYWQDDQEVITSGQPKRNIIRAMTRPDGTTKWFMTDKIPCRDLEGSITGLIALAVDITERKQLEEAFRRSEARYRAIIEDQIELVLRCRVDGTLTFANRAYCRYFGETPEQLIGHRFWHHIPEEDQERLREHLAALKPDQPVAMIEHRVVTATREVRWQQWTDRAIFDEQGNIVEFQAVGRDITSMKEAQEALKASEHFLRTIISSVAEGVIVTDADLRYQIWNAFMERLTGVSEQELLGKVATEVFPHLRQHGIDQLFAKALNGETVHSGDIPYFVPETGKSGWVTGTYSPHVDPAGNIIGLVATVHDISERKKIEEALQLSESKMRYLSAQLLTAQEREQKRISKELHDELGQSLIALKLQLRCIEKKLDSEHQALRHTCQESLTYIDQILENVQRLSRDLSPLILENLGLSSALCYLVDEFSKRCLAEFCLDMETIDHLFTQDSQILIYRTIQECLTNIAKHAAATQVRITIVRQGDEVLFDILDNGQGFAVADSSTQASLPCGLGLAFMDERVNMLGGSLQICSGKDAGTRITFTAPIHRQDWQ